MTSKKLLPCASCPWRVDQRGVSAIPGFDPAKAEGVLGTVGEGDGFRPIMACHHSTDERPRACKGYLAREGWSNINVRLLASRERIENPSAVADACRAHGVELEPDYPAVLRKLTARDSAPVLCSTRPGEPA